VTLLAPERVAAAAYPSPKANILKYWPLVWGKLAQYNAASTPSQIGAAATITVECPPWRPVAEYGEHPEYDTGRLAARLGNTPDADGDGQRYEGRGFIQLTGRANYALYGRLVGVDLLNEPERALEPEVAAEVFALYWKRRGVGPACEAGDWRGVRMLVNGGYRGWDRFSAVVAALNSKEPV
jgi:hypothetical protein